MRKIMILVLVGFMVGALGGCDNDDGNWTSPTGPTPLVVVGLVLDAPGPAIPVTWERDFIWRETGAVITSFHDGVTRVSTSWAGFQETDMELRIDFLGARGCALVSVTGPLEGPPNQATINGNASPWQVCGTAFTVQIDPGI